MMPRLRLRGLFRFAVSVAAFTCVAAVAYEAGAHGVGTGAWHSLTAKKETRAKEPPPMSEVEWSVTTRSDFKPTRGLWRAMDTQGELLAAQAALSLGEDGIAAYHLQLAAEALRGDVPSTTQKVAKELDEVARALENGKAGDQRVHAAIQDAFDASASLEGGES